MWSGWGDLNSRPPVPQTGALTKLRHSPNAHRSAHADATAPHRGRGGRKSIAQTRHRARLAAAPLCRCGRAPSSAASGQDVSAMQREFDRGYDRQPYRSLVSDYPDESVYPLDSFRVEWGPVFHRGRLDGTARLLVLGQDPAAHEAIARRILVGEAGQRVQGLLTRLGIDRCYVFVNTYLYSVFGQRRGERHIDDPAITDYRNRWLDAIVEDQPIEAIITLGHLA